MGLLSGLEIAVDFDPATKYKEKQKLRKLITENGGTISYIVTRKSKFVIINNEEKYQTSYKCKAAKKYNIPVVSPDFISSSLAEGRLLDEQGFVIDAKLAAKEFKKGKIIAAQDGKKKTKLVRSMNVKQWKLSEADLPAFTENFYIVKYADLQKYDKYKRDTQYLSLELHAALDNDSTDGYKFRVFFHYGNLKDVKNSLEGEIIGLQLCAFFLTSSSALSYFSEQYKKYTSTPHTMQATTELMHTKIGSKALQKLREETSVSDVILHPATRQLVENIWKEAQGELADVLLHPVESLTLKKVEEAEAILLQLQQVLEGGGDQQKVQALIKDFYLLVPHRNQQPLDNLHSLIKKLDLCQLIKDMLSVSEATNWMTRTTTQAKYRALRCVIQHLEDYSPQYENVRNLVLSSDKKNSKIAVKNVFEVHRQCEDPEFQSRIDNKRLLFHASKPENMLGILSRGLLLPGVVVSKLGGVRTDIGNLGFGIYFADASSTSLKYSSVGKHSHTRFVLLHDVALGKVKEFSTRQLDLTEPPDSYDSCLGVAKTEALNSDFTEDEYAIYSTSQQKMRYLVEFSLPEDQIASSQPENIAEESIPAIPGVEPKSEVTEIEIDDVLDVENPMDSVKVGLVTNNDQFIPLCAVHIRAKLIDLASQVVVFQEYKNDSKYPIEAKFVFPLVELAAVVGFEAFINDKHIVGEVQEKEKAHKEYREAVAEGHGAYLFDQETPDVFTVSIGNLPPKCRAVIKITYIAELGFEADQISFRIPANIAPWQRKNALSTETQGVTATVASFLACPISIIVGIEMPFLIQKLTCPTHMIEHKRSDTKAVVSTADNNGLVDGFHLLISIAEIHMPRMWVENYPNEDHQACMLTFFPEFDAEEISTEILFLLDMSNSMKGQAATAAKKALLLALHHLPDNVMFNVVKFGTGFSELFPTSVEKCKDTLKLAIHFVQNASPDLGNSELLRPLLSYFLLHPEDGSLRNVFLITDGYVNNEPAVRNLVRENSTHTRLFVLGVGSTTNRHFCLSLAHVGRGWYEYFDLKTKSRWEHKIISFYDKAKQPSLSSVRVDWQVFDDFAPPPQQAPQQILSLFNGSRQIVYGFVNNCNLATLKAEIGGKEVSTVVSTTDLAQTTDKVLHQLTARALIRDWEEGSLHGDSIQHQALKQKQQSYIIDLSKKYSVVTQLTSFIAVEERKPDDTALISTPSIEEIVSSVDVDVLQLDSKVHYTEKQRAKDSLTCYDIDDMELEEERYIECDECEEVSSDYSPTSPSFAYASPASRSTSRSRSLRRSGSRDKAMDFIEISLSDGFCYHATSDKGVPASNSDEDMGFDLFNGDTNVRLKGKSFSPKKVTKANVKRGVQQMTYVGRSLASKSSEQPDEPKEMEESSDDDDMGFGLFDDGPPVLRPHHGPPVSRPHQQRVTKVVSEVKSFEEMVKEAHDKKGKQKQLQAKGLYSYRYGLPSKASVQSLCLPTSSSKATHGAQALPPKFGGSPGLGGLFSSQPAPARAETAVPPPHESLHSGYAVSSTRAPGAASDIRGFSFHPVGFTGLMAERPFTQQHSFVSSQMPIVNSSTEVPFAAAMQYVSSSLPPPCRQATRSADRVPPPPPPPCRQPPPSAERVPLPPLPLHASQSVEILLQSGGSDILDQQTAVKAGKISSKKKEKQRRVVPHSLRESGSFGRSEDSMAVHDTSEMTRYAPEMAMRRQASRSVRKGGDYHDRDYITDSGEGTVHIVEVDAQGKDGEEEPMAESLEGIKFPLCSTSTSDYRVINLTPVLPQLLALQKNDGSWEFSQKLDQLIQINSELCISQMKEAGAFSLGSVITSALLNMLCTMIVITRIANYIPVMWSIGTMNGTLSATAFKEFMSIVRNELYSDIRSFYLKQGVDSQVCEEWIESNLRDSLRSAVSFCDNFENRYSLIYSSLQLGSSWADVAARLLDFN